MDLWMLNSAFPPRKGVCWTGLNGEWYKVGSKKSFKHVSKWFIKFEVWVTAVFALFKGECPDFTLFGQNGFICPIC